MVSEREIERAGKTLAENARSPATVIIFGSYARGEGGPDSDLDFLVIEREVESRIREAGRLRRSCPSWACPSTYWLSARITPLAGATGREA